MAVSTNFDLVGLSGVRVRALNKKDNNNSEWSHICIMKKTASTVQKIIQKDYLEERRSGCLFG